MSSTAPDTLRLIDARLGRLLGALPGAQAGDAEAVHRARVASRRLREALPVAGDGLSWRRARRLARRVTRALGPVREMDVALETLEVLARRGAATPAATAVLRAALEARRAARRREMLEALKPRRLEKLRRALTTARDGGVVRDRSAARTALAHRVARRAERLRRAITEAGAVYVPERLHAVRVAAKKLRYALELERELTRSRATARIRRLEAVQDLLGRLHDLEVLIAQARETRDGVAGADGRAAADLACLVDTLETECRQIHASYLRARRSLLALCAAVVPGPGRPAGPLASSDAA